MANAQDANIALEGRLTAYTTGRVWRAAMDTLAAHPDRAIRVDANRLEYADEAGLALLYALRHSPRAAGAEVQFEGLSAGLEALLARFDPGLLCSAAPAQRYRGLTGLGHSADAWLGELGNSIVFIGRCARSLGRAALRPGSVRWREVLAVATEAGANAVPIVCLIGFLMGVIIAFQTSLVAQQFGAVIFVVNGVAVATLRELGPLMTAIVFAGRSGAAFAAQLGTQKVNEELNAITTFGLDPIDFLVQPRLIASVFMVPLLAMLANLMGLIGGALVMRNFDINLLQFYNQMKGAVDSGDLLLGLVKAAVFGGVVAAVGCERGLGTGAGAAAVGVSTTKAVVASIVWIVVIDGAFAVLLSRLNI